MSDQENDITQPVVVNGSAPSQLPEEGTQPVDVTPEAPNPQVPEWLLKFAASPEQPAEKNQSGSAPNFPTPDFEDMEEEHEFIPPVLPGECEWQEISDFQEQDNLEPTPVTETVETPESSLGSTSVELAEPILPLDTQTELSESFRQNVSSLLKSGKRGEALALIRENKDDPVLAEAAKKTLRSQLTLSSDASDLWDVYDELTNASGE